MTIDDVLKTAVECLEDSGIEYMVAGSFASNLHGVPRTTQDADVVIHASPEALDEFTVRIQDRFYVDPDSAHKALTSGGMFNIIHFESGFKVDLIVRKDRPHALEEFRRKQRVPFMGTDCWFTTAEDTVLTKLEWSKLGDSERQYKDALAVSTVQGQNLDWDYMDRWAGLLDVEEQYHRLLSDIGRELPDPA